jgi:hypothetical protein
MKPQDIRALQEAYSQVYELDEAEVLAQKGGVPGSVKVKPALSIPGTDIGIGPNKPVPGTFTTTTPGQREKISKGDTTIDRGLYKQSRVGSGPTADERSRYNTAKVQQGSADRMKIEQVDLYDIILSHLLDEGYADTEEAATAIMANMSEEWRESIVEKFSPNIVTLQKDIEMEKAKAELSKLGNARRQRDAASELRSGSYGVPSFARSQEMDAEARHAEAGLTKAQSRQILAQNRRSLETSAGMKPGSSEKDAWYNDPNYGKQLTGKGTFFSPKTVLAKQGGKEGKLTTDPNTGKKTFTTTNWSAAEKGRYSAKGGK